MHIYLAFYVDTGKDYNKSVKNIESALGKYFGGSCSLFTNEQIRRTSAANNVAIVSDVFVYSIRKPVLKDPSHMSRFFESLEHIFTVLGDFSPHFTQEHHYDNDEAGEAFAGGKR